MQIYIMDCDYEVMKRLEALISTEAKCKAKCFTSLQALVDAVKSEPPDTVLLDFDAKNSYSGAKLIKTASPNTKIIIMSEDKRKATVLFELGLDGFILKPLDEENVKEQLFRLQHPILAKLKNK